MSVLLSTDLPKKFHSGKVRDTYVLDDKHLLLIATDRISAFDVIMPNGIPDKGMVLTQLSAYWFQYTSEIVPNHMVAVVNDLSELESKDGFSYPSYLARRSMIIRRAERIDVECVVRGYLAGSAWADYQKGQTICGITLPKGLKESDQLPEPIFTPTTKAESGHDEPITIEEMKSIVGDELTNQIVDKSLTVYNFASTHARKRGFIIADTKFEFGLIDGKLTLIDEILTPDSSRFWDVEIYKPGKSQPSYDKQPLRDWLTSSGWNKEPPAPQLPDSIVNHLAERYREAYRRITGKEL